MGDVTEIIVENNPLSAVDTNQLIANVAIAIAIMVVGIILGKIVYWIIKKITKKIELNKHIRGSFIDLFSVLIQWSIYILFLTIGIKQLEIPALTNFITDILITIPAFIGALVLLTIGFAIALYLREIIEDAEITGWDLISKVFFNFVLVLFGIYAMKTALYSIDIETTRWIITSTTAIIIAGVVYTTVSKITKKHTN